MPIRVVCPSCEMRLKVDDALMGKSIRCPQCTYVIRVAAPEEEIVDELEEIDGEEKPRPRGGRKAVSGGNLSIEHDVPEQFQDQIAQELSRGERLVWVGRPVMRLMMIRGLKAVGFGLFFLALIGFIWFAVCFPTLFGHKQVEIGSHEMAVMMGGIFFIMLIGVSLLPLWTRYRTSRTYYALTNRRAVVWSCELNGRIKVTSYPPADLTRMQRADSWSYGRGAGDLIFRSRTVVGTTPHGGVATRTYHYGFMGIDKVRRVEKLVRETLLDQSN